MADRALANLSASVLPDNIKSRLSGVLSYTPGSKISATAGTEGWIYIEAPATSSSTNVMTSSHEWVGTSIPIADGDLVRWICIEHTGTTDGTTKTQEGVIIGLNHAAGYDAEEMILIEPNEMIVLKIPLTEVHEVFFRTCTVAGGVPQANGSADAMLKIAAIVNNIS